MYTAMHKDNTNTENQEKVTVSVRLDAVPVKTHNKIKAYRDKLIKQKGKLVTLTQAYYEFLKTK